MTVEIQDFKLVAGNVYRLRGWPDEHKVAIVYHIGNDWEGKPRAFGITRMVKPDGVEECEDNSWDLDGSFGDIHGKSRLDIVAEIGSYFPAWKRNPDIADVCKAMIGVLQLFAAKADAKEKLHASQGYRSRLADSSQVTHRLKDFRAARDMIAQAANLGIQL